MSYNKKAIQFIPGVHAKYKRASNKYNPQLNVQMTVLYENFPLDISFINIPSACELSLRSESAESTFSEYAWIWVPSSMS